MKKLVTRVVRSGGISIPWDPMHPTNRTNISRANVEGLLMYRIREGVNPLPFHRFAYGSKDLCVDEVHAYLDTSAPIERVALGFTSKYGNFLPLEGQYAMRWCMDLDGDGDGEEYYIGQSNNEMPFVSNHQFFESFRPWELAGFKLESAGYLAGGSKVWGQVDVNADGKDFIISENDAVLPFFFFIHSHDGSIHLNGGLMLSRGKGNDTLMMSVGTVPKFKKLHPLFDAREVVNLRENLLITAKQEINKYKQFNAKKIINTLEANRFVNLIQNKSIDSDRIGRFHEQMADAFAQEIGNKNTEDATYWDLFTAYTGFVSHDNGNYMENEDFGDRTVRKLEAQWIGSGAKNLEKATSAIMKLME